MAVCCPEPFIEQKQRRGDDIGPLRVLLDCGITVRIVLDPDDANHLQIITPAQTLDERSQQTMLVLIAEIATLAEELRRQGYRVSEYFFRNNHRAA